MAKFYLQEMPNIDKQGKRKVYPKMQTNRLISNDELIERIKIKSGVFREGVVKGVLMTLADSLADYLSLGYTVKIDGLGVLSLSLEFADDKPTELEEDESKMKYRHVRVKDVNLKTDKELINIIRKKTDLERTSSNVNTINTVQYTPEERLDRALVHIEKYGSINLHEYCQINHMSRTSASRELKEICLKTDSCIEAKGNAPHRTWVKKDNESTQKD